MHRIFYAICGLVLCGTSLWAQTKQELSPRTWLVKQTLNRVPFETMPGFDLEQCLREDSINQINKVGPWRFGFEHRVNFNLQNAGVWDQLPNGDRVWRLGLRSPGALSLNLIFEEFHLPAGAMLHLYDAGKQHYIGAYTSANNNAERMLGTELLEQDNMIIEYTEPAAVRGQGVLQIGLVIHGYKSLRAYAQEGAAKALNDAGKCNHDVRCPLGNGWEDQINSVAIIIVNGSGACTGALINNTAQDGRPYFLTANHCLPNPTTGVGNWVFRFNWDSPTAICAVNAASASPPTPFNSYNGSVLRARSAGSDMALLELNSTPTGNVYYAGWSRSTTPATTSTGIHHPSGDVKKICRENQALTTATWQSAQTWRVADWDQGVTEPGSSGSPLFDQDKRIIGQLFGGSAACVNRTSTSDNNQPDYYGRFDISWTGGGTNASRLSNWLDPAGLNLTVLDGYNPNAPTAPQDGALTAMADVNDRYCGAATVSPTVTLRNSGTDPLTQAVIQYSFAGGTANTFNWTGNLASGASVTVSLPGITTSVSGLQSIGVTITEVNGQVDTITANNSVSTQFYVMANGLNNQFRLELDCYGDETTWELSIPSQNNFILHSGGPYTNSTAVQVINQTFCLDPGCYRFVIRDSYGDGLDGTPYSACGRRGYYSILGSVGDTLVNITAPNGDFGDSAVHNFCVIPPAVPVAGFTAPSNTNICEGGNVTYTNTSTGATSYTWTFDGGTPSSSTALNPTVIYAAPGTYSVTLVATNSLGSVTTTQTSVVTVRLIASRSAVQLTLLPVAKAMAALTSKFRAAKTPTPICGAMGHRRKTSQAWPRALIA